jgi:hypothetical protein
MSRGGQTSHRNFFAAASPALTFSMKVDEPRQSLAKDASSGQRFLIHQAIIEYVKNLGGWILVWRGA